MAPSSAFRPVDLFCRLSGCQTTRKQSSNSLSSLLMMSTSSRNCEAENVYYDSLVMMHRGPYEKPLTPGRLPALACEFRRALRPFALSARSVRLGRLFSVVIAESSATSIPSIPNAIMAAPGINIAIFRRNAAGKGALSAIRRRIIMGLCGVRCWCLILASRPRSLHFRKTIFTFFRNTRRRESNAARSIPF
jgi:hypothetical protein